MNAYCRGGEILVAMALLFVTCSGTAALILGGDFQMFENNARPVIEEGVSVLLSLVRRRYVSGDISARI